MTKTVAASLFLHPAFSSLSSDSKERVESRATLLRYRVGQSLTDASILPARVLVLVQGHARLLGKEKGRTITLARLEPGTIVGLVSLLRGEPCETVSAAEELLATSLDDRLIVELYRTEPGFRSWCQTNVWPAEVASILEEQHRHEASSDRSLLKVLTKAVAEARIVAPNPAALLHEHQEGRVVFLDSVAIGHVPGLRLDGTHELPKPLSPFGVRLLSLSNTILMVNEGLDRASTQGFRESPLHFNTQPLDAPESPEISHLSFQLRGTKPVRLVRGESPSEQTLACFQMLAEEMKLPFRRDSIEKVLQDTLSRGQAPTLQLCGQLAASLGLHVMSVKVPAELGTRIQTPAILSWKGGFALVAESHSEGITLASPADGMVELTPAEINKSFPAGLELLIVERTTRTAEHKFGPGWFWPALEKYRSVLFQVLIASFVVQLFTLANPLLIQVIIDKVISQRSLDTLQVIGIALVVVTLLEGVLGSLRTFLFAETTNRIDHRLGSEVIDHLLRLPLGYFDRRPVGELSSRVAELEKIRNFLTGQALTTVIDAAFSIIYILVMSLYSWLLTIIALAVLPIQVGVTILGAPLFRRQFRQAAEENARTQSHLVEVLSGIQTVKAQNVEMVSRWKWQDLYGTYIARTFEKTITGTAINQFSQILQKLSQLMVLWVGAMMVLDGQLTLGQLIAFRIISGFVTQPLLRLSSIWQNIQELRVSFERLADVIDTPQESTEADQAKIPLPSISGEVIFDGINFSFQANQKSVLNNINLKITAGTFVGIVGQSGSGKSTLMKLLPRLYKPDTGRILIDGYDVDKVELYSVRRQVGIVPQDPLLFSGTVNDNIALTRPDADSDDIVRAARLACAHEFIMELSSGYSTPVGERGGSLSGGQRQRIAIARTLLSNPKLLVLDEATSALDYDTERRVCENLSNELKECTVFFITHRLSTIRSADLIIMMHQGSIAETGTHAELMDMRGRYFALYRQQEAS
ncbi:peptidase domain-containing ABC transporter [Synechococcus sp. J7-Johnson]|uniref:peptidase domain-containing ABC transporter n=1 Tax=Synechococcus sp. J7-Johnson TaxID=2823737 RepID=UPI0020CD5C0C|nr:peptidase domain-containing ABC transporter [Synechococcus sp. J7-Johnson]MCP9840540.1 peptidase domain-containing ABC transporter [Synechococcus sp. J7-Johnson]